MSLIFKMNQRVGIYAVSLALSYVAIRFLVTKDVGAGMVYCILAVVLGSAVNTVVLSFLPMQLLRDLHKKAVLITGCDSGFGHLLAQRLDSLGMVVYAGCLFSEGSGATTLKKKSSDRLHIVQLDVTSDKQVEASVEYVRNTLEDKVLWAVVNNAGITSLGELEWHSMETIQNVVDVNFFGQIRIVKAFLPLLRESKGRIVNVLSLAGYLSPGWLIPYNCSKYAGRALTEGLRIELKKFSISVHAIALNFYRTPMMDILNTSNIWDGCPEHIKEVYGQHYDRKGKAKLRWFVESLGRPSESLDTAIDGMVEATVGVYPQDVHLPSLKEKLFGKILSFAPNFLIQQVMIFCQQPSTWMSYWNKLAFIWKMPWKGCEGSKSNPRE